MDMLMLANGKLTSFEESQVPLLVSPLHLSPPLVKAPHHALFFILFPRATPPPPGTAKVRPEREGKER